MKQIFQLLSVIVVIGVFVYLQREFFPNTETIEIIKVDTIWKYKTIIKDTVITKNVPIKVYLPGDTVYVPENCDIVKNMYLNLHKQHYTINQYSTTVNVDTIGTATVITVVSANKLDTLGVNYNIRMPIKYINTEITIKEIPNNWYIYGETEFNSIGVGIVHTRNNFLFKGTFNPIEKTVNLGIGYKIR